MRQPNSFNHCLTLDHMARLRALADQWGVSRSEMIRRLIDAAWRDRAREDRRIWTPTTLPPSSPE